MRESDFVNTEEVERKHRRKVNLFRHAQQQRQINETREGRERDMLVEA